MNDGMIQIIRQNMQLKSTEELIRILKENDRKKHTDAAFEAIRQVLRERGEQIEAQPEIPSQQYQSQDAMTRPEPVGDSLSALPRKPAPSLSAYSIVAGVGAIVFLVTFIALAAWSEAFPRWMLGVAPLLVYFIYVSMRQELKEKAARAYWLSRAKNPDADVDTLVQVCLRYPAKLLPTLPSSRRDDVSMCVQRLKSLAPHSKEVEDLIRSFE